MNATRVISGVVFLLTLAAFGVGRLSKGCDPVDASAAAATLPTAEEVSRRRHHALLSFAFRDPSLSSESRSLDFHDLETEKLSCEKGREPWSRAAMRSELDAFTKVFARAPRGPGGVNTHGSSFFHYFGLWMAVRSIRPTHIVESGCYRGVGTWFLRQAAGPDVKMTMISPEWPSVYVDQYPSSTYFCGTSRFLDFTEVDWTELLRGHDRSRTLIFFDDHQAAPRRVLEAARLGFKHVVFDDNYLPGAGDIFSLKQACHGDDRLWRLFGRLPRWLDNFGNPLPRGQPEWFPKRPTPPRSPKLSWMSRLLTPAQMATLYSVYNHTVKTYYEVPPVWAGPNRFGVPKRWWRMITPAPLLDNSEANQMIAKYKKSSSVKLKKAAEAQRYAHIVYAELVHDPQLLLPHEAPRAQPLKKMTTSTSRGWKGVELPFWVVNQTEFQWRYKP